MPRKPPPQPPGKSEVDRLKGRMAALEKAMATKQKIDQERISEMRERLDFAEITIRTLVDLMAKPDVRRTTFCDLPF